jgi:hypothetical protein
MPTPEQQEIWKKEKAQMLKDKAAQAKEIQRRPATLKFGGVARSKPAPHNTALPPNIPDDILRKRLGI